MELRTQHRPIRPLPTQMRSWRKAAIGTAVGAAVLATLVGQAAAAGVSGSSFVSPSTMVAEVGSTIPPNGDVNPYGVAIVRQDVGALEAGDVLVSNFNAGPPPTGSQGLGTTIVELDPRQSPDAAPHVFAQINPNGLPGACPGGVGLTTALSILPGGWVIVGSLPTSDGSTISGPGCLIVLDRWGHVAETLSGGNINGPWDMTALSEGPLTDLFFTNVLNGTVVGGTSETDRGTVVRDTLFTPPFGPPRVVQSTIVGSGFAEELNAAALVVGPTGVTLGHDGTLYVADTVNSQIDSIPNAVVRLSSAGTGNMVSNGGDLNGPLGLTTTRNGDILAANGGDGNLVALTPTGTQLGEKVITPGGAGSLFGLALDNGRLYFVDDSENQLNALS
jgi:sugar lactone lactonase YvrE